MNRNIISSQPTREVPELERLAQQMTMYMEGQEQQGRSFNRPFRVDALLKTVQLKQLIAIEHGLNLDLAFLEHLRTLTHQRWAASIEPTNAGWLQAIIGVGAGNRSKYLNLEATRDGVHAIIAGGTGAGKSELLMTLIVSLALRYDPSMLNFVLVDYKGGGAFKPFEHLPHCVSTVTNLNKAAVKRMFTAIRAELEARQKLNVETKTENIVDYQRNGYHLSGKPYPFLFIIIDEYAEMISDNPEFREELDSITRVGRAQGVHLFLASQRPTGVSDQMRENIKLRICLRVEQVDTSRELLRRSDAAYLPSEMPGRGYLQVGNENIELLQAAYTGEIIEDAELLQNGRYPRFYDIVVRLAQEILEAKQTARPRTPWPPPLPATLNFDDQLIEAYLDPSYYPLLTRGDTTRLALNPFVTEWASRDGRWYGAKWQQTAMQAVVGLLDDPRGARQIPLVVNFARGHAVLFGASGWGKTTFLRSLVVSLASTHSPAELHVHVLGLGGRGLEILEELPHVGTVIMPDTGGYQERVQQLWRELKDLVDHRKHLFSEAGVETLPEYNEAHPESIKPAMLVVIDNIAEYIDTFGNTPQTDTADDLLEAFVDLARQGRSYGIHFIVTASRLNVLSSKLYSLFTERLTLRLANADEYGTIVGSVIGEIEEVPGRGVTRVGRQPLSFQVALVPRTKDATGQLMTEAASIRTIGQAMHVATNDLEMYPTPFRINALPESVSYRELVAREFGVSLDELTFHDELAAVVRQRWDEQRRKDNAKWLRVPLGVIAGQRVRTLNFEAIGDGVHAMIAGGTGSGKSELLMTMIIGLALSYPPDILNFVLVDYKGGGAFRPFERLPHCVDNVTNLNKAAVHRMFTAINAEIIHRQQLNADTGATDIVDYRRKGLHLTHEPYPHLVIIIDEYAQMIDDNPEYRQQLESITRVGRALGVNLILASQRPKGVTDQMRANIKLRICLKVEQIETSRELLRRPDAALLPGGLPGRGYIQAGNENIELIQVAYSGEDMPKVTGGDESSKFFSMVVNLAAALNNNRMAPRLWPGFLPEAMSLASPLTDAMYNRVFTLEPGVVDWLNSNADQAWPRIDWQGPILNPVVGLIDEPEKARQEPHSVNLNRSHLVILGDAGSGKSTLLRTIVTSLAATYSPRDVHVYILDLGGRALRSLQELPHVGAVIYADEEVFEERLQRLIELLTQVTEERQRRLSEDGLNNLAAFNAHYPDQALPAIIVIIDNFAELQENHEPLVETALMPLIRRSLNAGITFVVSCNVPGNMSSKLYGLFTERLTFQQSNTDRYIDIVGRGAVGIDDIPGRGYVRDGQRPLLFQSALPVGRFERESGAIEGEAQDWQGLIDQMRAQVATWGEWEPQPLPIRVLQNHVSLEDVLASASLTSSPTKIVLGLGGDLRPLELDLGSQGPHFLVVGPPLSGKTTALRSLILSLADRSGPDQARLVLVDLQRKLFQYKGRRTLRVLPHVLVTIDEEDQLPDLIERLEQEGKTLMDTNDAMTDGSSRELFVVIDNFDELNDNLSRRLVPIVRRYGSAGVHFIISTGPEGANVELRRQIQSSNYGIGLGTAQAVESLRVARTPAGLRNRSLPAGRGYLVKSGQARMVQIATPERVAGTAVIGNLANDLKQTAEDIDRWVERIQTKYAGKQAAWSIAKPEQASARDGSGAAPTEKQLQMLALLQIAMRRELETPNDSSKPPVALQFLEKEPSQWTDQAILIDMLREVWKRQQIAAGLSPDAIDLDGLAASMSEDDLLHNLGKELRVTK